MERELTVKKVVLAIKWPQLELAKREFTKKEPAAKELAVRKMVFIVKQV